MEKLYSLAVRPERGGEGRSSEGLGFLLCCRQLSLVGWGRRLVYNLGQDLVSPSNLSNGMVATSLSKWSWFYEDVRRHSL